MTVVYTHEVATGSKGFGNFGKMLFKWTGSIYKLVLADMAVYMVLYYIINVCYRLLLATRDEDDAARIAFHHLVEYCTRVTNILPLQFVLGFYVSQIVSRWWSQFMTTPWPDTLAVSTATYVRGHDDRGRLMRRTILRYVNTTLVMVFTMISPQAKSRFPTLDHLVEAGFLVPHEKIIIDHLNEKSEGPKYFVPIVWAGAVAMKARKEGRIRDDVSLYQIIKELCKFRTMAGDLLSYDWVNIPMVYTQVAALCTYAYFFASLFGKQLIQSEDQLDLFVPVFNFMEFIFYMGWLKVAEILINPFGEDDDDFEVNWLIDRNICVSYMIVDEMNTEFPEMLKDAYWDEGVPEELPYTADSYKYKTDGMGQGSASKNDDKNDDDDSKSRKVEGLSDRSLDVRSAKNKFSLPFKFGNKHDNKTHPHHRDRDPESHHKFDESSIFLPVHHRQPKRSTGSFKMLMEKDSDSYQQYNSSDEDTTSKSQNPS